MQMFWKNMLRGAVKNRGSYIGAACIITFGTFFYIGMMDTTYNLQDQLDLYYQQSDFSDIFAVVNGISEVELQDIADMDGIDTAFGRLTQDVRVLSDQQTEIVTVHLMAYAEEDSLNRLRLSPDRTIPRHELYLGSKMTEAYGYEEGTELRLLLGGELVEFTLSGICYSSEYIYLTPPAGSTLGDAELYDIACVDKDYLEEVLGMPGLVNELGFTLEAGYSFEDVRYELMDYLEPYGLNSLVERKDQASYKTVADEVRALVTQGVAFMVIFMGMSIFMLYIMLKKIVDQDRTLIGTMKAMGFHDGELTRVYLWQGVIVGAVGAILASVLAIPFARSQLSMYTAFFSLPETEFTAYGSTRAVGFLISILSGVLAVYSGVRGIANITPAEAMRAAAPADSGRVKFPDWINRRLYLMHKIGLRSIVRNPLRSFVIALAIAFPFGCASVLLSFGGLLDQVFTDQFTEVHTYDIQISLDHYVPYEEAISAGSQLDGVVSSEAVTSLGVQLTNDNLVQHVTLTGYGEQSELNRIMDWNMVSYDSPDDGLILNQFLADRLKVKEGDVIEIFNPQLLVKPVKIPVKRIIQESVGGGCYLSTEGISRYFNTEMISNAIVLQAQPGAQDRIKAQLLETTGITSVVDGDRVRNSYREKVKSTAGMMSVFAIATVVCGMILIHNILMINVRERRTEFGTLKVLGTTVEEFRSMIVFEQTIYFLLGLILGIPVLEAVRLVVKSALPAETMNIQVTIPPSSCLKSFVLCLIILVGSSILMMRRVEAIMPADVLKDKE